MDSAVIEAEKAKLFNALETSLNVTTISAVAEVVKGINQFLASHLATRILVHAREIFPGRDMEIVSAGLVIESQLYELFWSLNDLRAPHVLVFVVSKRGRVDSKMRDPDLEIPLLTNGQYKSVHFYVDELIFDAAALGLLTAEIMSAGQAWLSNKIVRAIRDETAKVSTSLYDYLRMMRYDSGTSLDGLIFACLFNDKDYAVLDDEAAAGALRLVTSRVESYRRSAGSLMLQVIREIVKADDSVIGEACTRTDEFLRIELNSKRKFYRNSEDLADSMSAVWGGAVTCYPIIKQGQIRLAAFFPTDNEEILVPLLRLHRLELTKIAERQFDLLKRHLEILENTATDKLPPSEAQRHPDRAVAIGGVSGAFLGEFLPRAYKALLGG